MSVITVALDAVPVLHKLVEQHLLTRPEQMPKVHEYVFVEHTVPDGTQE